MKRQRFEQIVTAYGAKTPHWPATERAAAMAYLLEYPDNLTYQHALRLDLSLDKSLAPAPSPYLSNKILARIQQKPRDIFFYLQQWLWGESPLQHWWRPAFALSLPLIFGFILGGYVMTPQPSELLLQQLEQNFVSSVTPDNVEADLWIN